MTEATESRRSSRQKRTPEEAGAAEDQKVVASRASKDTLAELCQKGAIVASASRCAYPGEISGVYRCHLRALFAAGCELDSAMSMSYDDVDSVLALARSLEGNGRVFFLRQHHWVALTEKEYIDDGKAYAVIDAQLAGDILQGMREA